MTLNKYIDNRRNNNFNLIRFIAALSVIFAHSFPLLFGNGAKGPLANLIGMHSGEIAVDIFFIISGFLVGFIPKLTDEDKKSLKHFFKDDINWLAKNFSYKFSNWTEN